MLCASDYHSLTKKIIWEYSVIAYLICNALV